MWRWFLQGDERPIVIVDPFGGRMHEISETETPFPHRKGNKCNIQYLVKWSEDEGTNEVGEISSYSKALVWGHKYFKSNFKKLAQVKSVVDPGNFFRDKQSIPPL
ncbi:hypothetical protein J5N97_017771 [Dioscorea zingiberensis]|uniref:Berberine/berberine-like domain-containing protein n=1 Tax=Dioscorea zingiberensis TaxID=325984 RepID=A0A9D5CLY2_9LILI|nr:hypothetical protein J5N97_017771 [Dioscorea zingiberensis]